MKVEQRIENDRIFYDEKGVTQVKEIKRDMEIGSNLFYLYDDALPGKKRR